MQILAWFVSSRLGISAAWLILTGIAGGIFYSYHLVAVAALGQEIVDKERLYAKGAGDLNDCKIAGANAKLEFERAQRKVETARRNTSLELRQAREKSRVIAWRAERKAAQLEAERQAQSLDIERRLNEALAASDESGCNAELSRSFIRLLDESIGIEPAASAGDAVRTAATDAETAGASNDAARETSTARSNAAGH